MLQCRCPPEGVSTVLANVGLTERCDGAAPANSLGFSAMISLRRTPQGRGERELSAIRDLPMADGSWLGEAVSGLSSLPVGNSALMAPYLLGSPHCFFFSLVFLTVRGKRLPETTEHHSSLCTPSFIQSLDINLGVSDSSHPVHKGGPASTEPGLSSPSHSRLHVQFNKAVSE